MHPEDSRQKGFSPDAAGRAARRHHRKPERRSISDGNVRSCRARSFQMAASDRLQRTDASAHQAGHFQNVTLYSTMHWYTHIYVITYLLVGSSRKLPTVKLVWSQATNKNELLTRAASAQQRPRRNKADNFSFLSILRITYQMRPSAGINLAEGASSNALFDGGADQSPWSVVGARRGGSRTRAASGWVRRRRTDRAPAGAAGPPKPWRRRSQSADCSFNRKRDAFARRSISTTVTMIFCCASRLAAVLHDNCPRAGSRARGRPGDAMSTKAPNAVTLVTMPGSFIAGPQSSACAPPASEAEFEFVPRSRPAWPARP